MKEEDRICKDMPDRISGLIDLAYNFWWSWNPEGRLLLKRLSRTAWKLSNHNPVKMLCELDKDILQQAAKDPEFLKAYDAVMKTFNKYQDDDQTWFSKNRSANKKQSIAFFSAEYGLHHSLPFYAGGLGFFAGDLLKEASDLGLPVVGVGFMYPEGYIRQRISSDGWQMDEDEPVDRENAPIHRILDDVGKRLTVQIPVIDPPIFVEVCKVQIGRVPLYLMDTDIDANDPWNRSITSHLYLGNPEQRLRQEIVLGLGGVQVLNTLGVDYSALHLNEGHTVFAVLERVREQVEKGMSFDDSLKQIRKSTLFTTHTPVAAGNDVFPFNLIEKYFSSYWSSLGLDRDSFFKLGVNPAQPSIGFNMTVFGMRASKYHNAVSKRHGEVARDMWQSLWPNTPQNQIPIDSITNGVHVPTWIEPRLKSLFDSYLDPDWFAKHDAASVWEKISAIPDKELWMTHYWFKTKLILRILERARQEWMNETPDPKVLLASGVFLDPTVLTIGFARRFATYKRATLILQDIERLQKILNDRWKPVQIVFAGKAHPADNEGKHVLQQVFNVAKDPRFGGRIAFIEDYDEQLAQYMVHGVDVWLNNPLPPLEACGTSGMKASLNGVPNLSIFDGWWLEGFNGHNGWGFGKNNSDQRDITDSQELYSIIEDKMVPMYYTQDEEGIPHDWVNIMKQAIMSTAPAFSTRRMMKDCLLYTSDAADN